MAIWTPAQKTKAKKLKADGCEHSYEVEVPAPRVQEAIHNVFVRLQLRAKISGFRPGKAPLDLIKRQYGSTARTEAVEQVIRQAIPETLKELALRPLAAPTVGNVDVRDGKPLKFEMRVEVAPKFSPTGYKGINVTRRETVVGEAQIDERLKHLQEGNARLEKAEAESVGKEHYAVIDYELSRDGKAVKDGKGKQELVDMSSDQSIEGLAQGLLGAKRAQERTFEVKVDGKPAQCRVTVIEIKTKILPKLDDEFAKDMGLDSMSKLREELQKIIEKEDSDKTEREVSQQIETALLAANKFEIPASLADHQLKHMLQRLQVRIMGPDRKLPEKEAADLREKLRPQAVDQVRLQFIIGEIAVKEAVKSSDEEFEAERKEAIEKAENEEQKKKTQDFFAAGKEDIMAAIRERKVIKLIRDSAKTTTVKA